MTLPSTAGVRLRVGVFQSFRSQLGPRPIIQNAHSASSAARISITTLLPIQRMRSTAASP